MTEMTEENQRIKNEFQVYGLPTIQITNSEGKICKNETLSGFEDAPAFLARLERVEKLCQ
jgi:thiol:disulfide interchange protein